MTMNRSLEKNTVLLISSESQTEHLVREALRGTGFRLSKYVSGRKGLEAIPVIEPHLILVEFHTEDLDGVDVFRTFVEDHGFVRVLTKPGTDQILGVTHVGAHASDIIAEYVFAMKHGLGLNKILRTIHIYPTLAEANKYAAGEWKKAHAPEKLLAWLARYHAWMRGSLKIKS